MGSLRRLIQPILYRRAIAASRLRFRQKLQIQNGKYKRIPIVYPSKCAAQRKGRRVDDYCKNGIWQAWLEGWKFLDETVEAELDALPSDIRARFLRIARLIASEGLPKLREPYVKHLEGPLWEMRMKGTDGIARAAYVAATGQRVVVVRRVCEENAENSAPRD